MAFKLLDLCKFRSLAASASRSNCGFEGLGQFRISTRKLVKIEARARLCKVYSCSLARLEAAERCAAKFAREHAKARPQDFFSAVAFHETASTVSKKLLASDFAETFALGDRAANGTFYLQGLQETVLLQYP